MENRGNFRCRQHKNSAVALRFQNLLQVFHAARLTAAHSSSDTVGADLGNSSMSTSYG